MTERIVVGVDGSDAAWHAVRWAARHGGTGTDRILELVTVWQVPTYQGALGLPINQEEVGGLAQEAESIATEAAREVLAEDADAKIEIMVVEGYPSLRLLQAAEGADLLVVGSRGLGGFRGLLLGSVSQQCAQHAPCPVVIVRKGSDGELDRDDRSMLSSTSPRDFE